MRQWGWPGGWPAPATALLLCCLAACAGGSSASPPTGDTTIPPVVSGGLSPSVPTPAAVPTVGRPGPLTDALLPPDLLVTSEKPFPAGTVRRLSAISGVAAVEKLSIAQVAIENRVITVAAVDPASYRRYTPVASAQTRAVWGRVADGELAITPWLGTRLKDEHGDLRLGNDEAAPVLHIGALAAQIPRIDAVVNTGWGEELGMRDGNALLVSTERLTAPQVVRPRIERVVGPTAPVQILGPDLDITVQQTAVLSGGSVAASVGTFRYAVLGGGRIAPDPAWVSANIRTERVPILGAVTCHRVALPQLRAALTEVVQAGLTSAIHPDEYAGCYYPRYIAGTTQLSLHSFGIALDLNVPGNRRGTVGEMNRQVVTIFKKWGFAWGGDWAYTDPMHFELSRLVATP